MTADAFRSITFGNYLFWIVIALCFSLGFAIIAIWPKFHVAPKIMNQKDEPEFADVVVYRLDGPEALIEAIRAA